MKDFEVDACRLFCSSSSRTAGEGIFGQRRRRTKQLYTELEITPTRGRITFGKKVSKAKESDRSPRVIVVWEAEEEELERVDIEWRVCG